MGRKLLLINLLMVAAIVLLAQQQLASWSAFQSDPKVVSPPISTPGPDFGVLQEPSIPLGEFMLITEQNLFSENRGNEPFDPGVEEEEKPPEFTVDPLLISLSTIRDERQAVLKIATGRRGRKSENRTVKVSDDVGGYEVGEIGRDYLILRWKDHEQIIQLSRESSASNTRSRRSAGAVKIITVGTAAAAVETTQSEASEEAERGVQVGAVGGQQAGGRRGGNAQNNQVGQVGRGGGGARGNLTGRNNRGNSGQNQTGIPGTVGTGARRPPVQQNRPPE